MVLFFYNLQHLGRLLENKSEQNSIMINGVFLTSIASINCWPGCFIQLSLCEIFTGNYQHLLS